MRALVADSSASGRIALRDVPEPQPAPGEALVAVRAFSLNRGEMRMLGTAVDGWRPGWDFAGVNPPARPAILGRRVLVTGASGGVGRFALQLAHRGGAEVTALISRNSARSEGLRRLGADTGVSDVEQLRGRFDLILESVGGQTLGRLVTMLDPQGTVVMFGNSSGEVTSFNVRDLYLDASVRLQGFELFFGGDPFGRDLAYLVSLVAGRTLDPQLAGELSWEEMPKALELLRNRDVAGKIALTLGS